MERKNIFLLCRLSGMTLQSIGDKKNCSREYIRQQVSKASKFLNINFSNLEKSYKKHVDDIEFKKVNNLLDQYMIQFDRLPNIYDSPNNIETDSPLYKKIIGLNLKERLVFLEENKREVSKSEYDFHFDVIMSKKFDQIGNGYYLI